MELNPCELGTKEFWDETYSTEIKNYNSFGDVGEVWFDESSQFRVIKWMKSANIDKKSSIIDLGTGNGMMLIELSNEYYTNLTGVDYSPLAIELAARVAKDQEHKITFQVADLLDEACVAGFGKFKIVHDKGTYDAVALMENAMEKRAKYIKNVASMMDDDSFFIITSCNFTEDELIESFVATFTKHAVIPTQTFMFGGKQGNIVTSLVFKKCA